MQGAGPRTLTLTGSGTALMGMNIVDGDGPTSIIKTGTGTWRLSRPQEYTGTLIIKDGILGGNPSPLSTTIVAPGGSLEVDADVGISVIASGEGFAGMGALINSGGDVLDGLRNLTLESDITINFAGRGDIRGWDGPASLSTGGNDYKLTKRGVGQFSIVSTTVDPALGDIDIQEGIFDFEGNLTTLGNPAATITVAQGATVQFWGLTIPADKKMMLDGGVFQSGATSVNTFVGPVTLGANSSFDTINKSTLTISGAISGDGNGLTKTGNGTLVLTANNHYTGTTTVNAGTLRVSGSVADSAQIVVNNTATFDAASTQKLAALTVNSGGVATGSGGTLKIGTGANASPLTIAGTGQVDLMNRAVIVDSPAGDEAATLQSVRALVIAGYNHGDWLGSGITSSAAAADHGKAIGYALVSEVLSAGETSLLGQDVDGSEIIARYTLVGDANLDGTVGFADLVAVAQHYGQTLNDPVNAPSTLIDSWWTHGDFDYDGVVTFADLVAVAQNYGGRLPDVPGATAQFASDLSAVPEPGAGLIAFAECGFFLSRRRSRRSTPC
jgi:autotransporter-associated beta strand protein